MDMEWQLRLQFCYFQFWARFPILRSQRGSKGVKHEKQENIDKKVIFYICLLGLIILLVMPILWAMLLSLKTNNEIVNSPLSLPQTISFENYQRAIDTIDFSKMYFNTILLVVISTFFSILFTFMSSFAIARMVFRNHKASETLYLFLLIGIGIPIYVLLFPVYRIDSLMGILGTRLGLILPYVAVNISFNTLLFTGFLRDIPGELEEAAIIDGCNLFKLCTKVVIPVMKPTFVTIIILMQFIFTMSSRLHQPLFRIMP